MLQILYSCNRDVTELVYGPEVVKELRELEKRGGLQWQAMLGSNIGALALCQGA
jgi:hypothetical protein